MAASLTTHSPRDPSPGSGAVRAPHLPCDQPPTSARLAAGMSSRTGVVSAMTTWGFIGSGNIGGTVARLAVTAGHDVVLSDSRGPQTLADLVSQLGPHARAHHAGGRRRRGRQVHGPGTARRDRLRHPRPGSAVRGVANTARHGGLWHPVRNRTRRLGCGPWPGRCREAGLTRRAGAPLPRHVAGGGGGVSKHHPAPVRGANGGPGRPRLRWRVWLGRGALCRRSAGRPLCCAGDPVDR